MTFFVAEGPPSATFLYPPTDKTTQHKSTKTLHVRRNHKIHRTHRKRTACEGVHGKHGPHGKGLHVEEETTKYTKYTKKGLRKGLPAWFSRGGAAASLSVVPQGAVSPCTVSPPLSREHQKSIRRMRSVQDSVLPEGRGGEVSPHISPLIHGTHSAPLP